MDDNENGNENKSTIWSFLDVFLVLLISFAVMAQIEIKESNANDRHIPKIHVLLEQAGEGYATKCNGRYVDAQQLRKIILLAGKTVKEVNIEPKIEGPVPYQYIHYIKNVTMSCESKTLKIGWNTDLMRSYNKK